MAGVTESQVMQALRAVKDPDRGDDIVKLGMVSGLTIKQGNVFFSIEVDPRRGPQLEPLRPPPGGAARGVARCAVGDRRIDCAPRTSGAGPIRADHRTDVRADLRATAGPGRAGAEGHGP